MGKIPLLFRLNSLWLYWFHSTCFSLFASQYTTHTNHFIEDLLNDDFAFLGCPTPWASRQARSHRRKFPMRPWRKFLNFFLESFSLALTIMLSTAGTIRKNHVPGSTPTSARKSRFASAPPKRNKFHFFVTFVIITSCHDLPNVFPSLNDEYSFLFTK